MDFEHREYPRETTAIACVAYAVHGSGIVADPVEPIPDPSRIATLESQLAALAARVALLEGRPPIAPVVPRPAPPAIPAPPDAAALEHQLGTFWLSRIGIVSLITGAALLVITYFGALGPIVRVALGYAMAGALAWLGLRVAKKHETFGRIVFAGGLAIGYFVTYALHFVPAMRVVDAQPVGVALVAAAIAAIVFIAHRMKSETVAGVALFLGLHTGLLGDVTALSLVITTLLAAGGAFFLAANRWAVVPLSTVVAVYTTHATLRLHATVDPHVTLIFLAIDFALFAGATLAPREPRGDVAMVFVLLNALGAAMVGAEAASALSPDVTFAIVAGFAGVHVALAAIARARRMPWLVTATLLALALGLFACALPLELHGGALFAGWLALAAIATALARATATAAFAWIAFALVGIAQALGAGEHLGTGAQVAIAVALLGLERTHAPADRGSVLRVLIAVCVPLALLGVVDLAIPPAFHTLAWVAVAFLAFALGFALRAGTYRWCGFGVLGIAALRFLGVELRFLSAGERIATFVAAGALLLVVSFLYARRRVATGTAPRA